MNRLRKWCRGYIRIELTGASPELCLNRFLKEHISFWDVSEPGEFAVRCCLYAADAERASAAAARELCAVKQLQQGGFRHQFRGLLQRPFFVPAILLTVCAALLLQNFVWVLEVSGNQEIPKQRILRELKELGIGFGTWGAGLDTQVVKNQMLNRIPELSWLAVNQNGGVLTVLVAEREEKEQTTNRQEPADVIAVRDGVVTDMSVLNGFAAIKPGQAVTQGQLLVSGFMDWDGRTQLTRAIAEVYALTLHEQQLFIPQTYGEKVYTGRSYQRIELLLGRKRIKISGNSRISMHSCDKMTERRTLTLPGGITFPITLEIETYREYELRQKNLPAKTAENLLTTYYTAYVMREMIAGRITQQSFRMKKEKNGYVLTAALSCEEMIARSTPVFIRREDEILGADDKRGEN